MSDNDAHDIRSELSSLNDEIAALEATLLAKRARQHNLKGLVSPLHSIPPEIFSEIFLFTLSDILNRDYGAMTKVDRASVLNLCLVSTKWRSTALSTPLLWTSAYLNIAEEGLIELYPYAKEWFDRAGVYPKVLEIDTLPVAKPNTPFEPHGVQKCMCACLAGSRRLAQMVVQDGPWKRIILRLSGVQCFRRLSKAIEALQLTDEEKGAWKNLPSLSIVVRDTWLEDEESFELLPAKLNSLELLSYPYPIVFQEEGPSPLCVPFPIASNLTSLTLRCMWSVHFVVPFLNRCTKLEKCTLIVDQFSACDYGDMVAELPNLKELTVRGVGIDNLQLLRNLTTKNLQTLRFHFAHPVVFLPMRLHTMLHAFVITSGCAASLHVLEMKALEFEPANIVIPGLLQALPELRALHLDGVDISDELFAPNRLVVSKYLEEISLENMSNGFSSRRFWNFVELRRRGEGWSLVEEAKPKRSLRKAKLTYRGEPDHFHQAGTKEFKTLSTEMGTRSGGVVGHGQSSRSERSEKIVI